MSKIEDLREQYRELEKEFLKHLKSYKEDGLTNEEMNKMGELENDMGVIMQEIERLDSKR